MADDLQHFTTDLGEVRLHWAERGEGPPLVLIHGLNESHRTWRELWPRLTGRRLLMVDLPGHGLSGRPDAPYTLDWNAEQLALWMAHLELTQADLAGHSYGGGVAQWLLLKCRTRIRRLALLASGGLGREVYPWLRLASVPKVVELLGQPFIAPIAQYTLRRATSADADQEIALLSQWLREPGTARAFSRTVRDVIRWRGQTRSFLDHAGEVAALPPLRLFWGTKDTIVPMKHGIALQKLLVNCELVRFEGSGHFAHWEQPEAVAAALQAFFDAPDLPAARLRSPTDLSRKS